MLMRVESGEIKRLLITMPPRHGKSELCSVRFPAWYLGRNPDKRIIIASYAADLAERFSRQVRAVIIGDRFPAVFPGVQIAQDSRSVAAWDLAKHRGGLKAVGVGGPLTGFGANCVTEGTLVQTAAGPCAIEDVRLGTQSGIMVSYEHGRFRYAQAEAIQKRQSAWLYRITTTGGGVVELTGDHRVWTTRGYVEAAQLAPGDIVLRCMRHMPSETTPVVGLQPVYEPIAVVERVRRTASVYDIQVDAPHNFLAGSILVHNCLVIDDPVKNRAEAQSEVYRNSVWDWYTSTAYTRLEDAGAVVVVMTRWHDDDLMGRLLQAEADGTGDTWTKLHLPALDDQGRALWPEKYDAAALDNIRQTIGEYDWNALYMGTPTPREGAFFKVSEVRIVEALPAALPMVRAWDVAATPGDGDYTAGALMAGPDADGRFYVADMVRGQWDTDERNRTMRQTADLDGTSVRVLVPQDPGSAGVDASRAFVRLLSGYSVEAVRVTGEKALRADPFSSQVNAGNVCMVRGAWNRATLDEMRSFPLGRNDDQVDALADAFNALTRRRIVRAY